MTIRIFGRWTLMLNSKCNFKDKEDWAKRNQKIKMVEEKVKIITFLTSTGAKRSVDLDQRRLN